MTRHSCLNAFLSVLAISAASVLNNPASAQSGSHRQPAAVSPEAPFGFKAYGVFRRMVTERNYLPVVPLKDAFVPGTTDAVGAVSGLRGEISMIDGKPIVSYGTDCGTACPAIAAETATLLATAGVKSWREVAVPQDLDGKAVEAFIRAQAKASGLDEAKPFPFRIRGTVTNFIMHVNAAPNPRFKGHGSFDEMAVTGLAKGPRLAGLVVGFYAPPALQGVISHGGEYFHSHFVDEQKTTTAHLDQFGIAAGAMLMLPKVE